jgi:hypothetical protein
MDCRINYQTNGRRDEIFKGYRSENKMGEIKKLERI